MTANIDDSPEAAEKEPPRWLIALLAVACGLTVANLYYAQPLLSNLSATFHVSTVAVSELVTFAQLGYAAGLVFIVPLGDRFETRRLVTVLLAVTSVVLIAQGLAPTFSFLLIAIVLCAPMLVVVQILVPLAAELSPPRSRGKIVGFVMSGLLTGILLSRSLGSFLADAAGWRVVFLLSAAVMAVLAIVLHLALPRAQRPIQIRYIELLKSTAKMMRVHSQLRRRAFYQAMMFGAFSAFWTTISFVLTDAPFHFSQAGIGIFALVGAAGALNAPLSGRLADKGFARWGTGAAFLMTIVAFAIAGVGRRSMIALAVGAIILDMAIQTSGVIGQQIIYGLDPKARARINSCYMATFFIGGAVGSQAGSFVFHSGGWPAVAILGGILPLLAMMLWLRDHPTRNTVSSNRAPVLVGK